MSKQLEKGVTFIVISYLEHWEAYMFIGAMLCQTNPNWKIIIWHDDPNWKLRSIVEQFEDPRITYVETPNRGAYGAYNRIDALEMVDTEFVVQTTIQEYYIPVAVEKILENSDNDVVYWSTIHHSFGYSVLNSSLKIRAIDWSNFAMKTEIARKVGIKQPAEYCADGIFVEDCVKSGLLKKQLKLPIIMSIKN